jgi:hypothetical protein
MLEEEAVDMTGKDLSLSTADIVAEFEKLDPEEIREFDREDTRLICHIIALARILLEVVGGEVSRCPVEFYDSNRSTSENWRIYSALIDFDIRPPIAPVCGSEQQCTSLDHKHLTRAELASAPNDSSPTSNGISGEHGILDVNLRVGI